MTTKYKLDKLLSNAKAYEWLLAQGMQEHTNSCYHSDPDSTGPCNCGYLEDNRQRDYILVNK